jgi:hypothetical protein
MGSKAKLLAGIAVLATTAFVLARRRGVSSSEQTDDPHIGTGT